MALSDKEWESRTLCSDGNCIGVVGADGRCKVCGRPYEGTLPASGGEAVDDVPDEPPEDPTDAQNADHEDDAPVSPAAEDAWDDRILCIDESCIGIVGPDGRCKECGKPHPGKTP